MEETKKREVLFIGAGPGGYAGAIYAAKRGLSATVVEKRWIGGTCLNAGCIPTKALIRTADVLEEVKSGSRVGVNADNLRIDWTQAQAQKEKVTSSLRDGIRLLLEKNGVKVLEGTASFRDSRTVAVQGPEGEILLRPDEIVIAAGSKTKHLPIPGMDLPEILDSEKILGLPALPASLAVVGGGVIGMEFAFLFGRLGVKVQVVEFLPQVLPSLDADLVQRLLRHARPANVTVTTGFRATGVFRREEGGFLIRGIQGDKELEIAAETVLEAVGRGPDLSSLNLPAAGVRLAANGGIAVDAFLRTNVPHVHAVGDCTNLVQLAHVATAQAIAAVDDIVGDGKPMDYDAIPSVVFTTPEIAVVGKSEKALTDAGIPFKTAKIPYGSNGKALILNSPTGFVKLIQHAETGLLLGAAAFGAEANSLIAPLGVAIKNHLSAKDVADTVFAHPTLSELVGDAALSLEGLAIHTLE